MSRILEHLALIEVGHTTVFDVEPTAILHAKKSEHTKRSSGALEQGLGGSTSAHRSLILVDGRVD